MQSIGALSVALSGFPGIGMSDDLFLPMRILNCSSFRDEFPVFSTPADPASCDFTYFLGEAANCKSGSVTAGNRWALSLSTSRKSDPRAATSEFDSRCRRRPDDRELGRGLIGSLSFSIHARRVGVAPSPETGPANHHRKLRSH